MITLTNSSVKRVSFANSEEILGLFVFPSEILVEKEKTIAKTKNETSNFFNKPIHSSFQRFFVINLPHNKPLIYL
jgi:hypothetical protein